MAVVRKRLELVKGQWLRANFLGCDPPELFPDVGMPGQLEEGVPNSYRCGVASWEEDSKDLVSQIYRITNLLRHLVKQDVPLSYRRRVRIDRLLLLGVFQGPPNLFVNKFMDDGIRLYPFQVPIMPQALPGRLSSPTQPFLGLHKGVHKAGGLDFISRME